MPSARSMVSEITARVQAAGAPERAKAMQRFFKTGPGEYGEGDVFAGLSVPQVRRLAREYRELPLQAIAQLLRSPIHEARLLALFLLVRAFTRGDSVVQERIYQLYLGRTRFINNWDLVDCSAGYIVGAWLQTRDRAPLYELASSKLLWERRIAVLATFHFIRSGECGETLRLAEFLLDDGEDLIHKAVGWMLREIGKRNQVMLERFLNAHAANMPRTMLRYAIERFHEPLRRRYLTT